MIDNNGRLLHRFRQGEAGVAAHLVDYAFLAFGLIELYEATFEVPYLAQAIHLTELALDHFFDEDKADFFSWPMMRKIRLPG